MLLTSIFCSRGKFPKRRKNAKKNAKKMRMREKMEEKTFYLRDT
jgi:hypothetical protein